jgi:glycosyltransferase involved in cell wall biosynthesis
MRILFTFEFPFSPEHYGGGHQIARGLSRALARAGHEVHVLASGGDLLELAAHDAPVRWHFTGGYDRRVSGVRLARPAAALLDAIGPDLVCAFTSETPFVLRAARRRGIAAVVYLAAPELLPFRALRLRTLRHIRYNVGTWLQSLGTPGAPRVLTISRMIADQAIARWGVSPSAAIAVGTGIDEAFDAPLAPARPTPRPGGARVLSVGRITFAQKPLDRLAEGLALARDAWSEWTVIGGGPDAERLRAAVASAGLADRVHLLGLRAPREVVALIDAHDVVMLPSRSESFFITAYEAAARGRLLVTNDVAEVRSYFRDQPSVAVLPDDAPAGYAAALRAALDGFAARQAAALPLAARVRADCGWDAVAARFLNAADPLLRAGVS